jgi:large subunit ribosomal protein L15
MSKIADEIGIYSGSHKHTEVRKRVGRGRGSGLGKTCGRGGKGQTARSGVSISWFEGGQTPLYRRLPRRGFSNAMFKNKYEIVNVDQISEMVLLKKLPSDISVSDLVAASIVRKGFPVKLLGNGDVSQKFSITVDLSSPSAISKVEKAGGKVSICS